MTKCPKSAQFDLHLRQTKPNQMTKNLLLIAASLISVGLSAQKSQKMPLKQVTFPSPITLQAAKTLTGQTCDSIATMNYTASTTTISIAGAGTDSTVPSCTAVAGYVYGTNCYDDKEKAQWFDGATYYGSVSNLSVTAVKVMFWRNLAAGEGTQGGSSAAIGMRFYNGTSATAAPSGAAFGATTNPMATVLASATGNFFFHQFNYATPVPVQGVGFYASVLLPTPNPGDTAVIASQVSPTANVVWERFDDNSWHAVTETPASWGAPGNLVIIPKYCFNITTGITQNLGISNNIDIYPNPTSGIVKIQSSFATTENIEITVSNMLGQVVYASKRATGVEMMSVDISDQPNGVYFVSVSNATDKMVTRLILNK